MATTRDKFDSVGGFSIGKTTVVDELRNAKDLNSLEIKNSHFTDSYIHRFILRGAGTAILSIDNVGSQIPLTNNTLSFITGTVVGADPLGNVYSLKMETAVLCTAAGATTVLSTMTTVIKDDVPEGQNWDISPLSSVNQFSYTTNIAGTTNQIKWVAATEVVSIEWA